jgi:lipopolysaccharide export system protein LptA
MRALLGAGALAVCLALAGAARAEGIGVARFEVQPQGQSAPELGAHVAQRLATRGLGRVAGPGELGAPAHFEAGPAEAQAWARSAGVDAIVVGRTTRIGSRLSVDARLLDGPSGRQIGAPVYEEVARAEDLGRSIDRLTGTLVERLGERPGAVAAAPAARPETKAEPKSAEFGRGQPLSIHADTLDSQADAKGARHIVFTGHVRAVQGEMTLVADRLDAHSAPGASEPERLVARGHVTITQGTRTARCAEATFFRREERVVCIGQLAEIEQGCDRVRGPRIMFHLGSGRLEVEGGADVQIRPDAPGCAVATNGGGPRP